MSFYGFTPYVSVEEKRNKAKASLVKLRKKNPNIQPVIVMGRSLTKNWWGAAWNKNMESYADFSNRISRGKSYVKNMAVLDLQISEGKAEALVQGSRAKPYSVEIYIESLNETRWQKITEFCNHKIENLEQLLGGSFPKEFEVMFFDKTFGLFPSPKEIRFSCSCPDSAMLCKHIAATLYGIGVRLDENPLLFFQLRGVDAAMLIKKSMEEKLENMLKNAGKTGKRQLDQDEVEELFGMSLDK